MTQQEALHLITTVGIVFRTQVRERGYDVATDLDAGLLAYHLLHLRGQNIELDRAYRIATREQA